MRQNVGGGEVFVILEIHLLCVVDEAWKNLRELDGLSHSCRMQIVHVPENSAARLQAGILLLFYLV